MSKQMMIVVGVIVLLVIVGGVVMVSKNNSVSTPSSVDTQSTLPQASAIDTTSSMAPEASASDAMTMGTVKEFTVTGSSFKFEPATLAVNKGDTVKITFKNSGGMHNIMFDDFSAGSKTIQSGATDTFQFVASKAGSFQYYCSVGNHKAMGMVGTLTVK